MLASENGRDAQVRVCGFRSCGTELNYDGRGRPPEYCPDRRWPGGRRCKQMASADRAGERAASLDVPLADFRRTADGFVPVAADLARQLGEVVVAVRGVADGALTRVGEAERLAAAATERAQAAEEAAAGAVRARRAAETDRDQARTAASDAEQRARIARQEADDRMRQAATRVAEAEHGRGQAEATTAAATRAHTEESRRREAAEHRAAQAEHRTAGLVDQLAAATQRIQAAEADLRHAVHRATVATAAQEELLARTRHLETELRTVTTERDRHRVDLAAAQTARETDGVELDTLRAELDTLRAVAERHRQDADQARARSAADRATASAAADRAAAAESRLDHLLVALPRTTGANTGPAASDDQSRDQTD